MEVYSTSTQLVTQNHCLRQISSAIVKGKKVYFFNFHSFSFVINSKNREKKKEYLLTDWNLELSNTLSLFYSDFPTTV